MIISRGEPMAIFDHIVDLVDEFLTDCAFEAASEDEIRAEGALLQKSWSCSTRNI